AVDYGKVVDTSVLFKKSFFSHGSTLVTTTRESFVIKGTPKILMYSQVYVYRTYGPEPCRAVINCKSYVIR
ncbi:MAG: hypothetical protein ACW964_20480, partial [Candidatus Hodarchaeales archaeon]